MAIVDVKIEGNLLIATVAGRATANQVIAVMTEHYSNVTIKDVIWDLTDGSFQGISQIGFREIAKAAKESVKSGTRQDGTTVLVGNTDVEFGLLRMYSVLASIAEVPIKYVVCRTMEEAKINLTAQ